MTDRLNKTSICSIVFLDIIDHSKKSVHDQIEDKTTFNSLINEAIKNVAQNDRITIDTGDGAAIAFMGEPEDALFTALIIRDGILEHNQSAEQKMFVRIGINLGSVRVVKDINGRPNIIGDGINVAERIMSFSAENQILVSRSYYEVTARLTKEITGMFLYSGVKQDKHIREHEVYSIIPKDVSTPIFVNKIKTNAKNAGSNTHRSQQIEANEPQSSWVYLLSDAIKQRVQQYIQQIKKFQNSEQWASIQPNFSTTPLLKNNIKPILIATFILIVILCGWLIWKSITAEITPIEPNTLDTLSKGEVLTPVDEVVTTNSQDQKVSEYSGIEKEQNEIITDHDKINNASSEAAKNATETKSKIKEPIAKVVPIKESVKKQLEKKEPVRSVKPKNTTLTPSLTLEIEEVKPPPVDNRITCSQAQIAMNQCQN